MFLWVSAVVAAGAVVAVGAARLVRREPPPAAPSVAVDRAEIENLRGQVRGLQAQLGALAGGQIGKAGGAPVPAPAPPITAEQVEARARSVRAALFAALEEKLASEPVDAAWASGAAEKLNAAAARGAPFGTVQALRCTATLCKLVIAHPEAEDVRRFVEGFSADPPPEGQILYQYGEGPSPRTTVWVSRKGEKLPRPAGS
jgi:hypothetical protein